MSDVNQVKKNRQKVKEHRVRVRAFIQSKKDKPCSDCSVPYPFYVMQFDHVRGKKEFTITSAQSSFVSMKRLLQEIAKCDVVCANCHAERTHKRSIGIESSG